jgi:autotransporter-associated beta strand protein
LRFSWEGIVIMAIISWRDWLGKLAATSILSQPRSRRSSSSGAGKRRKSIRRLHLEALELRLAPATHNWTGAAGNGNWASPGNWDVPPTGGLDSDSKYGDLVFGTLAPANHRTTHNNLTVPPGGLIFNSITFAANAGGYSLDGTALTLGSSTSSGSSGYITVGVGSLNDTIALNMQLGNPATADQIFNVDAGASLTISGSLSGTTGSNLVKGLSGTLVLTADNSGFTGRVKLNNNGGSVEITTATALGTGPNTTVSANAQLQLSNVANPINEPLILNGPGVNNVGALLNVGGNNTWAGNIELDSDTTIGATAGSLNITSTISDTAQGHNLTKEGSAQVIFSHLGGNTYRGLTTINNGTLTIEDAQSLGRDLLHGGSAQSQALVNEVGGEVGTLQLLDPNFATDGGGFTVRDEPLTLNGTGVIGPGGFAIGALNNIEGDNTWAGNITLGSPSPNGSDVTIGVSPAPASADTGITSASESGTTVTITTAAAHPFQVGQLVNIAGVSVNNYNGIFTITAVPTSTTFTYTETHTGLVGATGGTASLSSLIISGVIGDVAAGSGPFHLNKADVGELILNNANTYVGGTSVLAGILDVRDSQALGPANVVTAPTLVDDGASLALEVDTGFDAHGRNLADDSITGFNGNGPQLGMTFDAVLGLSGVGFQGTGALHSISGINKWTGPIFLDDSTPTVAIGVDPDPHPSTDNTYFTHDYSLQVTPAVPQGPDGIIVDTFLSNASALTFEKVDLGQLILLTPNPYTRNTDINQGWITIGDPNALGPRIPGLGDTGQPYVQVDSGAALHLVARPSAPIDANGATESGSAVTITTTLPHPYQVGDQVQISGVGVAGYNGTFTVTTVPSATSFTYTDLQTGLGNSGGGAVTGNYNLSDRNLRLSGTGITHPFGLISQKGALMDLSAANVVSGDIQLLGTTGIGVEQVFPVPPSPPALLTLTGQMKDSQAGLGDITKFGSGRLILQGDGSYSGANEVAEGSLRIQNDTALGRETTGTSTGTNVFTTTATTVDAGAVLELSSGVASLNGGIAAGIQVYDEHLILNGPGQQISISGSSGTFNLTFAGQTTTTLDITSATLAADMQAALNALSSIAGVGGFVTVTQGSGPLSNVYTIVFGGSLLEANNPLMTVTTSGPPDNATIVLSGTTSGANGTLESPIINLDGDNMWRGPVSLNTIAPIDVAANSRLSLFGTIDDAANPSANGSDLIKLDGGELVLAGSNSYRGVLHVGLSTALGDPVNLAGGLVTIENSQALGATAAGVSVIADSPGGATESGSVVTITTTAAHGFTAGQEVQIFGVAVAGYNGTFTITSVPSSTTFTYTDTQTGLAPLGPGNAGPFVPGDRLTYDHGYLHG